MKRDRETIGGWLAASELVSTQGIEEGVLNVDSARAGCGLVRGLVAVAVLVAMVAGGTLAAEPVPTRKLRSNWTFADSQLALER